MKYFIRPILALMPMLFLFSFLFTSCKSDKPADQQEAPVAETDKPVHIKSERAAVLIGFWHYAMIVGDDKDKELYKGRWIDIKRDDTFTSGLYDQETNSGTWSLAEPTSTVLFKYDKPNEGLAYEWKVQGNGTMLIWKGNTASNPKGTQIKMMKQDEPSFPTAQ